jgi:elongation factor P--(R)-beta-lysine ligase
MTDPWWRPDRHGDRRGFLLARDAIKRALRTHLERQDFLEVECGALQVSPGNEAHLHAFSTQLKREGGGEETLYLHTSPEFACKKLLAAGERRIFDFARVYRNCEQGPLHSPEFTLLEWYRADQSYEAVMEDCVAFARLALEAASRDRLVWRDRICDPHAEPERLTLADAFERYAQIDLMASLWDREALARAASAAGVRAAPDDGWSDLFSRILVDRIEPRLGEGRLTILYEYPASEAALARRKPADRRVAERFEVYACGVELANGFRELTDPLEQRARLETEMDEKARVHGERYPIDDDFITALGSMPEASGCAMGFDRLVVLATGARHISDVLWTPPPG